MDYVPYLVNRFTDLPPGSIEAPRYHASPRDRRQEGRVSITARVENTCHWSDTIDPNEL